MRTKDFEDMVAQIIDDSERIEFTGEGEEGFVSFDVFIKKLLSKYQTIVSKDKFKELIKYIKKTK